jgi:hypothetical protein
MTTSPTVAELAKALAKAQQKIEGAAKGSLNPHFKSKYADLASVWDACHTALNEQGVAVLQPVSAAGSVVTVTTLLLHASGEWISEALEITAAQNTAQAVGSAITYGRRYGLSAMVGVAPEDDDGEAASTPRREERAQGPTPAGYADWLDDLRAAADRGDAELKKAWKASKPDFRNQALERDAETWARIKERAITADRRQAVEEQPA